MPARATIAVVAFAAVGASAAPNFSEGFEDGGLSQWTQQNVDPGNGLAVTQARARSGASSLEALYGGVPAQDTATTTLHIDGGSAALDLRFFVLVTSGDLSGLPSGEAVRFLRMGDAIGTGANPRVTASVSRNSGGSFLRFNYVLDAGTGSLPAGTAATTPMTPDQWNEVVVRFTNAPARLQLQANDVTALDLVHPNFGEFQLWTLSLGIASNASSNVPMTIYFDDVSLGPSDGGTLPGRDAGGGTPDGGGLDSGHVDAGPALAERLTLDVGCGCGAAPHLLTIGCLFVWALRRRLAAR